MPIFLRAALRVFLLITCFAMPAFADVPARLGVESLPGIEPQRWQAAADHPQWRALLHFRLKESGSGTAGFGAESYVDDPDFFLSNQGHRDPLRELHATVLGLTQSPQLRCRLVARFHWLQQQGLIDPALPLNCAEYERWRVTINAGSVALVFASSYLNSPSSMYGHTFLRVDPAGYRADSALLSYAVNYAAVVPDNDNSLLFAWRGMSGGYPGHFSLQPYVEKLQEYSRLENRDIWEYELNLTADEIDRLMAHLWELQNINFDYYFMDENCSFRLLELLEVARPGLRLTDQFPVHAIPVDTVRSVRDAGLVSEVVYRPSRQRELSGLVENLSAEDRRWVKMLADDPAQTAAPDFAGKPDAEQHTLLLAAYRLLRYEHNRTQRSKDVARRSLALLRAINRLPAREKSGPETATPPRPDLGHQTGMVSLGAGRQGDQDFQLLNLRMTYHDLLDPFAGYPRDAALNMLGLQLRKNAGDSVVESLDLVDIRSLAPRDTFFQPLSWQASGGLERAPLNRKYLAPYLQGGAGGSWEAGGGTLSLLLTLRAEYNEGFAENWQVAPGLDLRWGLQGKVVSLALEANHLEFGNGLWRQQAGLSAQWSPLKHHGLRLGWQRHRENGEADNVFNAQWRVYF